VEAIAANVFKAAVLGLILLRKADWGDAATPGTKLEAEVRDPAATHTVILQQLQRWYDGAGSPHEVLKKRNVKELLA